MIKKKIGLLLSAFGIIINILIVWFMYAYINVWSSSAKGLDDLGAAIVLAFIYYMIYFILIIQVGIFIFMAMKLSNKFNQLKPLSKIGVNGLASLILFVACCLPIHSNLYIAIFSTLFCSNFVVIFFQVISTICHYIKKKMKKTTLIHRIFVNNAILHNLIVYTSDIRKDGRAV